MTSGLRPGQRIEVRIEKGVYRGLGLARHEGQVVFVPRAVAGDHLRVRVESVSRGYLRAAIEERIEAGPGRRASPCPYVPRCGGCAYQDVDYPFQLEIKEAVLRESLLRSGVDWSEPLPLRPSPEQAWRTRATFHFGRPAEGLSLGLHEEGSHRVVDLENCLQVSAAMNGAARALVNGLSSDPRLRARVREASFAESFDGAELVLALEGDFGVPDLPSLARTSGNIAGVSGLGTVLRGRFSLVQGDPYVHAEVHGRRFRAHVGSFFQANRFLVGEVVGEILARVPPGRRVLDLYAGVGLFSICLADRAEDVVAVEQNPSAVQDAEANAAGLRNVRCLRGEVAAVLASLPLVEGEVVILDPPRTGAGVDVVKAVAARRPAKVIYVSCDPPTLGRDLKAFATAGYGVERICAFDLFPDTFHLETLVELGKAPATS